MFQHVNKVIKGTLMCDVPVSNKSSCSVVGHFGLYIRLSETVWLRTVFAVVIGDVGVIIEDLEEQQSYFGVIDFSTATGNVRQVRQEFQPCKCFLFYFFRGE